VENTRSLRNGTKQYFAGYYNNLKKKFLRLEAFLYGTKPDSSRTAGS